jgi:site-specific recombinase XerC
MAVLDRMSGLPRLMATLLYGSGLRLLECACLRVKDLDFERREVLVRDGKGQKDRVTMLPFRSGFIALCGGTGSDRARRNRVDREAVRPIA